MKRKRLDLPAKIWLLVFGGWLVLLSGIGASVVGSPGVLQAMRLSSLLDQKESRQKSLETQIQRLEADREVLEKSRVAQEREIRKTLGYAAADELIFDF